MITIVAIINEWSGGCIVAALEALCPLEASGQTNPSESVERGRQAFLAKAFSQYPSPPLDLILIFDATGALVLTI